jgi:hypothetical protein
MSVGFHRHRDGGVPQNRLDGLHVDAVRQLSDAHKCLRSWKWTPSSFAAVRIFAHAQRWKLHFRNGPPSLSENTNGLLANGCVRDRENHGRRSSPTAAVEISLSARYASDPPDSLKGRFSSIASELPRAFAADASHEKAIRLRDDIAFFHAVRAALVMPSGVERLKKTETTPFGPATSTDVPAISLPLVDRSFLQYHAMIVRQIFTENMASDPFPAKT